MLAETLGDCDMLTPSPSVDNFSALAAASSSGAANSGTPSTPVTPRRRRRNRMSINLKKLEVTLPKGALEGVEGLEGSF